MNSKRIQPLKGKGVSQDDFKVLLFLVVGFRLEIVLGRGWCSAKLRRKRGVLKERRSSL